MTRTAKTPRRQRRPAANLVLAAAAALAAAGCSIPNAVPDLDPGSRRVLEEMSATIAHADRMSFEADLWTTDPRQDDQVTERSHARVTIDRPNKVFVQESGASGVAREFFYNGRQVTLSDPANGTYSTSPAPPTIDEMLNMISRKYELSPPLAVLLRRQPFEALIRHGGVARVTGTTEVGGVPSDEITFAHDELGWILAVGQHDRLPRRLAIRSNDTMNAPVRRAQIHNWDLDAPAPVDLFEARLPDGAQRVEWAVPTPPPPRRDPVVPAPRRAR
jgi:hypothetical protein